MAGQEGYTFEELQGAAPTTNGGTPATPLVSEEEPAPLVFADRTKKKRNRPTLTSEDIGGTSRQRGELPTDPEMRSNIRAAAKARGMPEEYLFALIQQESGYNPNAYNEETGATGLAQYIPASARDRKLDPRDPIASLAWAAKDFQEQAERGGIDWAIKHHFAGPNTAGHGPKTRQYLADVNQRARDIRALLDAEEGTVAEARTGNVVAGGSDVAAGVRPPKKEEVGYTFDELVAGPPAPKKKSTGIVDEVVEFGEEGVARLLEMHKESLPAAVKQLDRMWDATKRRFSSEGKQTVTMSRQEIDEAVRGMNPTDAARVRENYNFIFPGVHPSVTARTGMVTRPTDKLTATIQNPTAADIKDAPRKEREYRERQAIKGFFNNLEQPVKLLLEDSLPANLIESLANTPDFNYQKMQEASAIRQQYDMVNNPTKYPPAQVAEARQAIAERAKPKDKFAIWNELKKAAAEDPGGLAAKFVNAIMADPQLVFVPLGSGAKGLTAVKTVAQGLGALPKAGKVADVAAKAARIGDKLVDPAVTGAVTNIAIEAGAAASEGEELTGDQALVAGLTGGIPAGFIGGLSAVPFLRGVRAAREKMFGAKAEGKPLTENMLDETMDGNAAADALAERIIVEPNWLNKLRLSPDIQARIEAELGIQNMTPAQRKAHLKAEREKWTRLFEGTDLEARVKTEYPEALQRARESLAASQKQAAEAARREALRQRTETDLAARHQEIEDNYTEALAARDRARELGEEEAAYAENELRDSMTKLDEEEIYRAAVEADAPAVRRAMNNAARRDSQLERPKWQRGDIDPELLAKMGVGSIFAGTAYAFSPEQDKVRNAVTAALFTLGAGSRAGRALGRGTGRRVQAAGMGAGKAIRETSVKLTGPQARWFGSNEFADMFNQWAKDEGLRNWERPDPYIEDGKLYVREGDAGKFADFLKWVADEPRGGRGGIQVEGVRHGELADVIRSTKNRQGASIENPLNFLYDNLIKKGKLKPDRSIQEILAKDRELAELAKMGKQDAIKEIFQENYGALVRRAKPYARTAGMEADDIVQETFERLFTAREGKNPGIADYKGDVPLRVWMATAVANKGKDAVKAANAIKRGGGDDVRIESLDQPRYDEFGEDTGQMMEDLRDVGDETVWDSPENAAIQEQYRKAIVDTIQKMPDDHKVVFLMSNAEGKTFAEISEATGIPPGTVGSIVARTQEKIEKAVAAAGGEPPIKGIKGPKGQRGFSTPETLAKVGIAGTLGLGAATLANKLNQLPDDEMIQPGEPGYRDPISAGVGTALLASIVLFGGGGKAARSFKKTLVEGNVVPISTRILKKAAPVFKIAQEFEMRVKGRSHAALEKVTPFLKELKRMPEESRNIFTRALMTGNKKVIDNMLEAYNNPALTAGYKDVRSVLDSLGDQLKMLKRFSPDQKFEYFPRLVKDLPGLLKAIESGKAIDLKAKLEQAGAESIRKNGRPLSETETARIVNQELFSPEVLSGRPGWAKNRGVEEITPELLQYYHTPEEALGRYINSAVTDVELAKLFGKFAENRKAGGFEYLDLEESIGSLLGDLVKTGKMTSDDAVEVGDMLKTRFGKGEELEADWIRRIKDVGNAGMLGNLWSASSNLIDIGVQAMYVQGMRSTLGALVRQATGRKLLSIKDFGLTHISEEFSSPIGTTKWVNRWLRLNLFNFFDAVGKNNALNGAMLTGRRLAQTDSGVAKLAAKYQEIYGKDFAKLVSDLKNGKRTQDTDLFAWMELSRTQPISKLEMPQNYLNNPNMRAAWWMKSFVIKQIDLLHRDGVAEIKKGNIAKGSRNLIQAGIAMGLSGASVRFIQDWLKTGEPPADAGWEDIPLNMFRNLGFSEYTMKDLLGVSPREAAERRDAGEEGVRASKAKPLEALLKLAPPPYRIYQDVITGKPQVMYRAMPWISPWILEQSRQTEAELRGEDE